MTTLDYHLTFKGDEKHLRAQIDLIKELIQNAGGKVFSWKKDTNEHKTMQYCGVPLPKDDYNFKYTLGRMTSEQFSKVAEHLGKPAKVVVDRFKQKYHTIGYIPMFNYMGLDNPPAFKKMFTELFFDLDEYFARAKKLRNISNRKVVYSNNGEGTFPERQGKRGLTPPNRLHKDIKWQTFSTVKTATVKLQPWSVMDKPALDEASRQLHNHITGIDTAGLMDAENRLRDEWNASLKIYRLREAPEDKNSIEYKTWEEQKYINEDLKDVRSQLGIVKRKLTRAMKSGNGIDFDLSDFSIV